LTNGEKSPSREPAARSSSAAESTRVVLGIAGRVFFVACVCGVVGALLFGAPRLLYSYHVSHFAALYVLTLATLAAFPEWGLLKAFWRLVGLVTVLGVARVFMRRHLEANFLDWISDLSGIIVGLAPVAMQSLREAQLVARQIGKP
jgi:4-amino-4-deoxy-L-arabinose transferase-like glycosyltransferase